MLVDKIGSGLSAVIKTLGGRGDRQEVKNQRNYYLSETIA